MLFFLISFVEAQVSEFQENYCPQDTTTPSDRPNTSIDVVIAASKHLILTARMQCLFLSAPPRLNTYLHTYPGIASGIEPCPYQPSPMSSHHDAVINYIFTIHRFKDVFIANAKTTANSVNNKNKLKTLKTELDGSR